MCCTDGLTFMITVNLLDFLLDCIRCLQSMNGKLLIITAALVGGTSCVTVHIKFVTVPLIQSFPLVGLWS